MYEETRSGGQTGKDPGFLRSTDGIFKGIQFILSLLLVIFVSTTHYWSVAGAGFVGFANFAAWFSFITLLMSGVIYYFRLYNGACLGRLPWRKVELNYALGSAILHFIGMIACSITASSYSHNGLFIASAIFSVFVMLSFLVYAFIIFRGKDPRSVPTRPIDSV
ncbi:uncharacterized protein LOC143465926 [Clavelina lepadiformis]|uniref:MARVEL domain-containing protein n=1 Tax=Clavelina lepadiformis TaxID=159417 RepID=A0ABP0F1W4_CLALP